jgi:hypothetical protein
MNRQRAVYVRRYGLSKSQTKHVFSNTKLLDQLAGCKSEAARRLLLGVSIKTNHKAEQKEKMAYV